MANGQYVGEGINCLVIDIEYSKRKWQKAVECEEPCAGWLRLMVG